jgi:hypothetical protein
MIHDQKWPQYETARRQIGRNHCSGPGCCSGSGPLASHHRLVWGNYLEAMVRYWRQGVPWLTEDPQRDHSAIIYNGEKDRLYSVGSTEFSLWALYITSVRRHLSYYLLLGPTCNIIPFRTE